MEIFRTTPETDRLQEENDIKSLKIKISKVTYFLIKNI